MTSSSELPNSHGVTSLLLGGALPVNTGDCTLLSVLSVLADAVVGVGELGLAEGRTPIVSARWRGVACGSKTSALLFGVVRGSEPFAVPLDEDELVGLSRTAAEADVRKRGLDDFGRGSGGRGCPE